MPDQDDSFDFEKSLTDQQDKDNNSQVVLHIRPDLILPHIQLEIDKTRQRVDALFAEIKKLQLKDVSTQEDTYYDQQLSQLRQQHMQLKQAYDYAAERYRDAYHVKYKPELEKLNSLKSEQGAISLDQLAKEVERASNNISRKESEIADLHSGKGFMPLSRKDKISSAESTLKGYQKTRNDLYLRQGRYRQLDEEIRKQIPICNRLYAPLDDLRAKEKAAEKALETVDARIVELEDKYREYREGLVGVNQTNVLNKSEALGKLQLALTEAKAKLDKLENYFGRLIEKIISQ